MMLLCYTLFDYDDIILEPENQCSTDNAWGNAPAYVGFCITGVLIPFSFHTFCGGLEAFGGWLVYLIVKSMWASTTLNMLMSQCPMSHTHITSPVTCCCLRVFGYEAKPRRPVWFVLQNCSCKMLCGQYKMQLLGSNVIVLWYWS